MEDYLHAIALIQMVLRLPYIGQFPQADCPCSHLFRTTGLGSNLSSLLMAQGCPMIPMRQEHWQLLFRYNDGLFLLCILPDGTEAQSI